MKEFDLKSIWEEAGHEATAWYDHLRPDLIAKARKQSNSVLYKLKRFAMIELISGVVFTIVALIYMRHLPYWLLGTTFLFLSSLIYISYRQYWAFKKQVALVPTLNIIASTTTYLHLITDYRKRSTRLAILITPLVIVIGLFLGYVMNGQDRFTKILNTEILITLGLTLILLSVIIILTTKWYYNFFIGSKEKELQFVLDSLGEEE